MDKAIRKKVEEWMREPYNEETRREVKKLFDEGNEKELADRFYRTLEFGTGGLRGVIGAGTNRMNVYTVGMATQGLANYIKQNGGQSRGVVIARDSRIKSDEFAKDAAAIFAGNGIKVYTFDDIMPVPICSFAIRELGAMAGITVTASHNPPEYNGYKVYWEDGAQVVSPQDNEIIDEVQKIQSILDIKKMNYDLGVEKGIIITVGDDIIDSYIQNLEKCVLRNKKQSDVTIAYTPLHGTGYRIIPHVLSHFGFTNCHVVEEQEKPDGNFPTVKSPNPEDRPAMEMVLKLGQQKNAHIILATDPDGDRMGVAFRDQDGEYILINGNQIGTMLEYYILSRLKESGDLPDNGVIVKTIVTTDLQEKIAADFNLTTDNVLTGFKWIARKMYEYDKTGSHRFIFGGEESYGYLPVTFVRDKDAISSCYFFAEMTDWLREQDRSLNDFLEEIYSKYGYFLEGLNSITLKGMEGMKKIQDIMNTFRTNPPGDLNGIPVTSIVDIEAGTITHIPTGQIDELKDLPKSNVLQYFMEDGSKVTMRPSGTEPKIKFYFSVNAKIEGKSMHEAHAILEQKIHDLQSSLMEKVGV
jgi:phosphoglucomutase